MLKKGGNKSNEGRLDLKRETLNQALMTPDFNKLRTNVFNVWYQKASLLQLHVVYYTPFKANILPICF